MKLTPLSDRTCIHRCKEGHLYIRGKQLDEKLLKNIGINLRNIVEKLSDNPEKDLCDYDEYCKAVESH